MPKYFDIHSHLNFRDYDKDRQEVIKRLKESDTHTIVIGTDFASSQSAVELANAHEGLYASIGVHPIRETSSSNGTSPVDFDVAEFEKLVKHPKVVAVGECGLDFYHAKKETDFERQKKLFLGQALFAIEHNKPLMIHARPARTTDIVQSGGNPDSTQAAHQQTPFQENVRLPTPKPKVLLSCRQGVPQVLMVCL